MTLTPEDQKLLRRPFTAEAVRFRISGKITPNKTVRVLTYIDARLAAERLTEVDADWTANYNFFAAREGDPVGRSENLPVACNLTVKGITRSDVGQNGDDSKDDKHVKSAVSDALKRAAVNFGVGAYLYTLGDQKINAGEYWVGSNGKAGGINEKGMKRLRAEYAKFIAAKAFRDRFGEPIDYGDSIKHSDTLVVDVPSDETEQVSDSGSSNDGSKATTLDEATAAPTLDNNVTELDAYSVVVADLAKATGRSADAAIKWIEAKKNKDLAVKRAVKQAGERGAKSVTVEKILSDNNMSEHMKSFVEVVTA